MGGALYDAAIICPYTVYQIPGRSRQNQRRYTRMNPIFVHVSWISLRKKLVMKAMSTPKCFGHLANPEFLVAYYILHGFTPSLIRKHTSCHQVFWASGAYHHCRSACHNMGVVDISRRWCTIHELWARCFW